MAATVIEQDLRPAFRVAAFGLTQKLQRVLEIVLRHARHNRYRYVLAAKHGPGDFDIAMVDMTVRGGDELARTLKRLSSTRPVVTIGRRADPNRACDDLLQHHFTLDLLPTLNGTVERYRLLAHAVRATLPEAGQSATFQPVLPLAAGAPATEGAAPARDSSAAQPRGSTGGEVPVAASGLVRGIQGTGEALGEPGEPRPRALIVDDSPTVRHQLALALLRMGVDSEAVGTLQGARSALEAWRYDLVIIDVVMADGDGIKLTREIRRNPELKGLRLVILTSRSSPLDLVRGALAGCNSYLVKPVSPKSLRETVMRNLNLASQARRRLERLGPVRSTLGASG